MIQLLCENAIADHISEFNLAGWMTKNLGGPWRPPITSSTHLVTEVSEYTPCALYGERTVVYYDIDILTSNSILLLIFAASGLTGDFWMGILGHTFSGCIGSVAVESLLSALLLCDSEWRVGWSVSPLAWFRSTLTFLRCCCSHDLLVWNRRGRWCSGPFMEAVASRWYRSISGDPPSLKGPVHHVVYIQRC